MTLPRYLEDDDEPTVPVAAHCASEIDDAQPQRPDEGAGSFVWGVIFFLAALAIGAAAMVAMR